MFLNSDEPIEYGFDSDNLYELWVNTTGRNRGFRIELDVNQEEYCGSFHQYHGAGFIGFLHDSLTLHPFYADAPSFQMTPGYEHEYRLIPKLMIRKTHHLGLCAKNFKNMRYNRELCVFICLMSMVVTKCKCYPTIFDGWKNILIEIGYDFTRYPDCDSSASLICMQKYLQKMQNFNFCPEECLPPCQEYQYRAMVNSRRLNSLDCLTSSKNSCLNESAKSRESKNKIVANFFLESMLLEKWEDTQAYSLVDLLLSICSTTQLFFGSSVVSICLAFLQTAGFFVKELGIPGYKLVRRSVIRIRSHDFWKRVKEEYWSIKKRSLTFWIQIRSRLRNIFKMKRSMVAPS